MKIKIKCPNSGKKLQLEDVPNVNLASFTCPFCGEKHVVGDCERCEDSPQSTGATIKDRLKSRLGLLVMVVVLIVVSLIVGLINFSDQSARKEQPSEEVAKVQDTTIVLTKGHLSKRKFTYAGEVDKNGLPNGQGRAKYPETEWSEGCTFEGTFEHGITKNGKMDFDNGPHYRGSFTSEGYFLEGTWTEKDGYYFTGTYKNGEPYNGTWYTPDGKKDSEIVNGK